MKTKKGRKAPNDSATEFKVGFKKKGNDGNMWQVMKTTKGVKRWIKDDKKLNCKDMVLYQKQYTIRVRSYKQGKRVTKTRKIKSSKDSLKGIKGDKGHIYLYKDKFNQFEKEQMKIPKEYVQTKLTKDQIKLYCGDKEPEKIKHQGKIYMIHDNGGRPFLVSIVKKNVLIYKIPEARSIEFGEFGELKENYTELIKEYKNVKEIFIGKSHKSSEMARLSKGYGSKFTGNSILLKLGEKRYCSIGWTIEEFSTKDRIIKYDSPVGNNDVPYPLAYGEDNLYFMLDMEYVPRSAFPKNVSTDNAWEIYHGECCPWKSEVDPYKKKIMNKKLIHKRI